MKARTRTARALLRRRSRITRGMARRRRERWHLVQAGPDQWVWFRTWITPAPVALQILRGALECERQE